MEFLTGLSLLFLLSLPLYFLYLRPTKKQPAHGLVYPILGTPLHFLSRTRPLLGVGTPAPWRSAAPRTPWPFTVKNSPGAITADPGMRRAYSYNLFMNYPRRARVLMLEISSATASSPDANSAVGSVRSPAIHKRLLRNFVVDAVCFEAVDTPLPDARGATGDADAGRAGAPRSTSAEASGDPPP
ncbi:hypothetical protein ZWY2020_011337 [Hordeum vulgare]|nr:hypothetical protein ZWY2020_011337 [Hordeum vulgare]